MYRNLPIEKIIEASKLTNYTREKFARPVRPVTSTRYIHIRQKPTKKEVDQAGSVTAFFPGHVDLVFSRAETTIAKSLVGPDTRDYPDLSKVLANLGLDAQLTMGHAPQVASASLQRCFKTLSSMGVDYHNIEYKAQPWYADYFATKSKTVEERDLGELRPAHVALLLQIANEQLRRNYSLGGASKAPPDTLWTIDEFTQFFTTGVAPAGADNCCDFIARSLAALARYEAPDTPGLQAFLYQLGFVKQPQDLVELAVAFFKRGKDGFVSFAAPPYKPAEPATPVAGKQPPAPARELTPEEEAWGSLLGDSQATQDELTKDKLAAFRKSANHAPFAKAFGGDPEVFNAIAKALHEDDSIFDDLFASPKDLAWGSHWFKALGERLSPDADKALIEAHVTALSEDDRYLRFGEKALDRVLHRLLAAPHTAVHFGVFDPTGKAMVGLGQMRFPVGQDGPAVDVGFSVLPAQRHKGVAKLAMQWAMCRARNRGMRLLVGQYHTENTGSAQLLASVGNPVTTGTYAGTVIIEMALPEADGASHLLEATHLHLSSGWAKK